MSSTGSRFAATANNAVPFDSQTSRKQLRDSRQFSASLQTVSPEQNPNFFPTKSRRGMNRSATASLHSATLKKNVPCFFDVVVVEFFLKKERAFFFGVLPSRFRAGGGTIRKLRLKRICRKETLRRL